MDYKKKYFKYKKKYLELKNIKKLTGGMIDSIDLLHEEDNSDTIEINIKIEDTELTINVSPSDDVHEKIKEYLNISHLKKINISYGGIEIESSTTFEENGIKDGAHISVIDDFCKTRWENYNMLFSDYIKLLPLHRIYYYIKKLKNINNYELEENLLSSKFIATLLQLIENTMNIDTKTATLCEVQNALFDYNILLPSDEYLTLINELKELYEQCEVIEEQGNENIHKELNRREQEIKKKIEELEQNEANI